MPQPFDSTTAASFFALALVTSAFAAVRVFFVPSTTSQSPALSALGVHAFALYGVAGAHAALR